MTSICPPVSVNITTYNRAHLLERCIGSVLKQTYQNLEIVIVDDCSVDNTSEVVHKYQKTDNRIKYIRHEYNKKLPSARNTAWKNSSGEYIAFMDDDDEWIDKDKIRKQVDIFENACDDKLAIVCTSVRLYSDRETFVDKIILKPKKLKNIILSRNGIIYTPTVMTKKIIIEKVGGFDVNLSRGVDSDFYRMCIVRFGYDVYFMIDVTTGVHEYGDDRITPQKSKASLIKTRDANAYLVKKYLKYYFLHPKPFLVRMKNILKTQIQIKMAS